MRKILFLLLAGIGSAVAQGPGTQFNPTTQIAWPLTTITGSDTPIQACSSTNYGQPFQRTDVTPNKYGTCGADGWQYRGVSSISAGAQSYSSCPGTTGTAGLMMVMKTSSTCALSLPAVAAGYNVAIQTATTSTVTIAPPGGVTLNVGASTSSVLTIPNGQTVFVTTDGTSYFATAPAIQGSGVTITPGATGNVYSSTAVGGVSEIIPGTGITCTPLSGGNCVGNVTVNGAPFGYPAGTVSPWFGNSFLLVSGYTHAQASSYSSTSGTVTIQAPNNYAAGQTVASSGGTPACLSAIVSTVTSATPFQFVISGTSCGTASGSSNESWIPESTAAISCTSNICDTTSGNTFVAGDSVVFAPGSTPVCLEGRSYKVLSAGLSSTHFRVDTTNWGNCGTTTGSGVSVYWTGNTNWPDNACRESWFSNVTCQNYGLSDGNSVYQGTLSSLATNYTAAIHPIMAAIVTAAAGKPVPVYLYSNDGLGVATDESNFLTLAADFHAEGSNVQVIVHTIPPAIFGDPDSALGNQHQALDWATESSWMYTKLGIKNATVTGQYFDRVVQINGVLNQGMSNSDAIHMNNAGTQALADKDNADAGLVGTGATQNSPAISGALTGFMTNPFAVCDPPSNQCSYWLYLPGGAGAWTMFSSDPLIGTSNILVRYANDGSNNIITPGSNGCFGLYPTFGSDHTTQAIDAMIGRGAAGLLNIGSTCRGGDGGVLLTYLRFQDTTAPSGSCSTVGRWEWAQDGTSAWCNGSTWQAGSTGSASSGTVTYTSSQTASSSDNGKLVIFNCSSACAYTLPATQPSTTWSASVQSIGSTTATIALGGGNTYNGGASVPVLLKYATLPIWANTSTSTDYRGGTPPVAGSNVTITSGANGQTYASTGGGSTTVSTFTCADTSGSPSGQSCTASPTLSSVGVNTCIAYTTTTANSGTLTLNVSSLTSGAHVKKWGGSADLASGDIPANKSTVLCYDGTSWDAHDIGNAPTGGGGSYPTAETHTASTSTELDFTTCISGSYSKYQITITDLIPTTASNDVYIQFSTNGGSSYDASNLYGYAIARWIYTGGASSTGTNTTPVSQMILSTGSGELSNSTTGGGFSGTFYLMNPGSTASYKKVLGQGNEWHTAGIDFGDVMTGTYASTTAVNAFRIKVSAGTTIASGTVTCQPMP